MVWERYLRKIGMTRRLELSKFRRVLDVLRKLFEVNRRKLNSGKLLTQSQSNSISSDQFLMF